MIWNFDTLKGYTLRAADGSIGRVHDLLFEDRDWTVRYLVVDTGSFLFGRRVLIVPSVLGTPDADAKEIEVALTVAQVESSPSIETDRPVNRQQEALLHRYYGWAPYWTIGGSVGGAAGMAAGLAPGLGIPPAGSLPPAAGGPPGEEGGGTTAEANAAGAGAAETTGPDGDPHLRSTRELAGYTLSAPDGDIGSIDSLLLDTDRWTVRRVVVDTGTWLPGRKVVIDTDWISTIEWAENRAGVSVPRSRVEAAPDYDVHRHQPLEGGGGT
ncbi:PRC-barrel domain-containing protein [Rhodospirillum centenum]|uniref:PRC-barrel domain-containing protein n=1 Tax=Rhodospirillum centenum (strain ATCC 51521 / SW) TaxID=414684 RepID=B6IWY9_RHOCS|nr:PRC-barrel domain-containing protein [Rhodospirillum centenum]ACJ00813.1 conserved hypothetical protein [Rhodospirillum centenum SW]